MTTIVAGVIVAGVGSNASPHGLENHTNVGLSNPNDGDVIRYDAGTGLWKKVQPSTLPVPSHNHDGVYVTPAQLTSYAPKANPQLTGVVTVSDDTPTIKLNETDNPYNTWDNSIRVFGGGMFFRMAGEDVQKIEAQYVNYLAVSLGMPYKTINADVTVNNPGCVHYVDASGGAVTITLFPVANFYRLVTRNTGVLLYFVRKDDSANAVTIVASAADSIDGAASITLTGKDSHVLLQGTDGGWRRITGVVGGSSGANDSGWQPAQWLSSNLSVSLHYAFDPDLSGGEYRFRRIGDFLYIDGWRSTPSIIPANNNIVQVPVGMYPSQTRAITGMKYTASSSAIMLCQLKTDGYISIASSTSTNMTLDLSGCVVALT